MRVIGECSNNFSNSFIGGVGGVIINNMLLLFIDDSLRHVIIGMIMKLFFRRTRCNQMPKATMHREMWKSN